MKNDWDEKLRVESHFTVLSKRTSNTTEGGNIPKSNIS